MDGKIKTPAVSEMFLKNPDLSKLMHHSLCTFM